MDIYETLANLSNLIDTLFAAGILTKAEEILFDTIETNLTTYVKEKEDASRAEF